MEKKWFVALLMVVVMMCACWTGDYRVQWKSRKAHYSRYACWKKSYVNWGYGVSLALFPDEH